MSQPFGLPTDTRAVNIESRQYNLFGIDLGEGLPRVAMKVGGLFYVPWFLLFALLGVPILGPTMILWVLPPTLALLRALMPDEGGRLRLVTWADRALWLLTAHPPIVNADTAGPLKSEPLDVEVAFLPVVLPRYTRVRARTRKEQPRGEVVPA